MKRVLVAATGAVVLVLAVVSTATARGKPLVEHFRFDSEPFFLDLSDPFGSAQCDVQAVGFDTGVVTVFSFFDEAGELSHTKLRQSLSTILTNPENGKSIEFRGTIGFDSSFTESPVGSFTLVERAHGLNIQYKGGERVLTFAGQAWTTVVVQFDSNGDLVSVDVEERFTPHLQHSFPLFCELLA